MRLVRAGFSQKRKQLRNNLQTLGLNKKQLTAILDKAGIDTHRRAETLSLAEWAALYETLLPALSAQ